MSRQLPATAHFHYVCTQDPAQCPGLSQHLHEPTICEAALCLGFVPTAQEFAQMLAREEIEVWQVFRGDEPEPVAYALDCHRFEDHEQYVHPLKGWDNALMAEVLGVLAAAAFATDTAAAWVWTAIPLPLPDGAESTLITMGYDVVRSDTDRGLKKTFGLERAVWAIYNEAG